MSKGFHKCDHCGEWHDCNRPTGAGCVAVIGLLLLTAILVPLMVDFMTMVGCSSGYSWAQPARGCDAPNMVINDNLERRVKALEEKVAK